MELADAAENHLFDDFRGLGFTRFRLFFFDLSFDDILFAFFHFGGNVGDVQANGSRGGDMHRQVFRQFFQSGFVARRFQSDQRADFAQTVGNRAVHIADDDTVVDSQFRNAAQVHVFADFGNQVGQRGVNILAVFVRGGFQSFDIAVALQSDVRRFGDELLEQFVFGNEVGFRVDFDDNALFAVRFHSNQTLSGNASRFFRGGRQTFFAQPVNGFFDVAVGCGQRFFAIHHSCAGFFAQFFYGGGGNFSHLSIFLSDN